MAETTATILLAEDDDLVRKSLKILIESNGFTLLEACDGQEALRLFRTHPGSIDLLITDLSMPRMNGKELAERVKSFNPDLPVIFISGKGSSPALKKVVLHEGSHFLSKPFSYSNLVRKMHEILDGRVELGEFAGVHDRLIAYAKGIGVMVKVEAVQSGLRVLVPSSSASINDSVITSYIEEELKCRLAEDPVVAPAGWRRLGILST